MKNRGGARPAPTRRQPRPPERPRTRCPGRGGRRAPACSSSGGSQADRRPASSRSLSAKRALRGGAAFDVRGARSQARLRGCETRSFAECVRPATPALVDPAALAISFAGLLRVVAGLLVFVYSLAVDFFPSRSRTLGALSRQAENCGVFALSSRKVASPGCDDARCQVEVLDEESKRPRFTIT